MNEFRFTCADCGEEKCHVNPNGCGGTGYATVRDGGVEKKVCYDCIGKREIADMIETGRAVLYLTVAGDSAAAPLRPVVTNWPGTLKIPVKSSKRSRNNFGAQREDVWFNGPDGKRWWGVNIGDNMLCRCRRLKSA